MLYALQAVTESAPTFFFRYDLIYSGTLGQILGIDAAIKRFAD